MLKEDTWNAKIKFESQKVFIQFYQEGNSFQHNRIPGRICLPVYLAIKMRRLRMNYELQLLENRDAKQYNSRVYVN
jgi:hypothetical protein